MELLVILFLYKIKNVKKDLKSIQKNKICIYALDLFVLVLPNFFLLLLLLLLLLFRFIFGKYYFFLILEN